MKTKQEMLNHMAKKLANKMIRADSEGWPPDSTFGFYQPMRPQKRAPNVLEDTPVQRKSNKSKK